MTDILFVWFPVIAASLAAVFGIFLLFLGSKTYVNSKYLQWRGVRGVGQVTRHYRQSAYVQKDQRPSSSKQYLHLLDYRFHLSGEFFNIKGEVPSKELWDAVTEGSEVDIIYQPSNPQNSQLAERSPKTGLIGGTLQMIVGTFLTMGAATYLAAGLFGANENVNRFKVENDWINDQAIVRGIGQSDDPFVRIMQPNARLVSFEVGNDDGGREVTGLLEVLLSTDQLPDLQIGDVYPVMRDPQIKDWAVLNALQ